MADHFEFAFQLENLQADDKVKYHYCEDGKPMIVSGSEQKNQKDRPE